MIDIWSQKRRSDVMSRIKAKNTRLEIVFRLLLHRRGFRYRLHVRNLPGIPDLAFPKFRSAIFVNGCFWHMHAGCKTWKMPKSNIRYWRKKLIGNAARDLKNKRKLRRLGWKALSIWECEIERDPERAVLKASKFLRNGH